MFVLKIKTEGTALLDEKKQDPTGYEVRKLMKCVEAMLKSGVKSGTIEDDAGNYIGEWRYE